MGSTRRFKRRNQRKENERKQTCGRQSYEVLPKENSDFVKYYKAQKIVPDNEWNDFISSLKRSLPTSFRIMGSDRNEAKILLDIVKGDFFACLVRGEGTNEDKNNEQKITIEERENEGGGLKEPFQLPWYPDGLGWQLEITRKDIRRSETYFRLHNFLVSETSCGAISRQEAVSMIPPLLMDIRPHHKVLDMCAAPGSKTAQIIELLHSKDVESCSSNLNLPSGFVVANDMDNSRCYMLVHQSKRLNSPCVLITNHDAGSMPNFKIKNKKDGTVSVMKFDRILCDAPCSGDGTLRKNIDIWPKWNPANGNNLHGVQYRLLRRGLEMLEINGRIVYSTCSLNPVENEAVIARILTECQGSVRLLESSLPGLKTCPGLLTWLPSSKDLTLYRDYSDVEEKWCTQVRPNMFPPTCQEDLEKLHLSKCIRILPHSQDTGGFFVAVLTKINLLPWESGGENTENNKDNNKSEREESPPQKKRKRNGDKWKHRYKGYKEDPYIFFNDEAEETWQSIRNFYKIEGLNSTCLLTRCATGKKKNIYFVSPHLKDLIELNQDCVKIVNTGVKAFARCDNKAMLCPFRLVQEGIQSIGIHIGKDRRVELSKEELIEVLYKSDPSNPLDLTSLKIETQERLKELSPGSCILECVCILSIGGKEERWKLVLVGWKGSKSLRAYISLQDSIHNLRLLGADVSRFEVNKFVKKETEDIKTSYLEKEELREKTGEEEEGAEGEGEGEERGKEVYK